MREQNIYEFFFLSDTHLEYLLEEWVECVLLHLGLPLTGLAPVRQQVDLHIPANRHNFSRLADPVKIKNNLRKRIFLLTNKN